MKIKLLLIMLLISSVTYEASATITIVFRGCTNPRTKFHFIHTERDVIICEGAGTFSCPSEETTILYSGTYHALADVVDFVYLQIKNGFDSGNSKFKNEVPVKWKKLSDDSVQIDVEEKGTKQPDKDEN
jgi:hypothetical protein